MKLHPNAKTTPFARELLVNRVRGMGWSIQDAAQAAGISLRTRLPLAGEGTAGGARPGYRIGRVALGAFRIARVVIAWSASSGCAGVG